ncbi:hypothetical protein H6P81_016311 [Aristolochia fimbriata]|uniref:SANTA domain-containing protein n=1 Tax=Aristolochia fimbriata TaxID=158543 RepID=A0AAV7EAV3_ARIFI|nr:hypothetical protein H6P81_016311 [Aristolochia fimbriata]
MQEVFESKEQVPLATPSVKTTPSCCTSRSLGASGETPFSVSASRSHPKRVFLYDWWLIKAETSRGSKELGVGGMAWTGLKARRIFHSSAIVKRHDSWNLETADGIMVTIHGLINRSHTYQNGYSAEVCCIFQTGFPFNWDTYANDHVIEDVAGRSPRKVSSFEALCKIPTTKYVQDLSGHVLQKCGDRKDQNLISSYPSTEKEVIVRSETNLSCMDGRKLVTGDTENCCSNSFTEQERKSFIELKSREGVHPERHSESINEGSKVNPSPGEVICKESQNLKSWSLRSRKVVCVQSISKDGSRVIKRSRSAGTLGKDLKSKPVDDEKNVIASEGEKGNCMVGASTSQTRRSSSRLQKFKDEAKNNLTTIAALEKVKSEIITTATSPNIRSPLWHNHVVEVKQEIANTRGVLGTPMTTSREKHSSFSPSESLNWRRSRSGRLIAPKQAVWLNQRVVYEQDGRIIGVETGHMESPSGIRKRKGRN